MRSKIKSLIMLRLKKKKLDLLVTWRSSIVGDLMSFVCILHRDAATGSAMQPFYEQGVAFWPKIQRCGYL